MNLNDISHLKLNVDIEIDGGINASTIGLATERGAQLFVAGSAIFKQDDYSVAMESMMARVKYNQ